MGVLLGLLSALGFGSGDFLGGQASKRASTPAVLFVVQLTAALGAIVLAIGFSGDPIGRDLTFGAAAGIVNAIGLGLLYHGLGTGRMGVVAPVAAVMGAVIPVAWGLLTGEQPGTVVIVGVLLAVVAVALIAREHDESVEGSVSRSVVVAVLAGVGLGTSLVFFAQTGSDSGFWPVLTARIVATAVAAIAIAVAVRAGPVQLPARPRRAAMVAGIFDVAATAFVVTGVRDDLAVIVAPIAALGSRVHVDLCRGHEAEPNMSGESALEVMRAAPRRARVLAPRRPRRSLTGSARCSGARRLRGLGEAAGALV